MANISEEQRKRNERAIREAADRLLQGDLPPGGRCDIKTLAAAAGVSRTGFYPKPGRDGTSRPGPYQHLAEEFSRRLAGLREAGEITDPRDAQIKRLKSDNTLLKRRLADRQEAVDELVAFRRLALSRLTAQHDEITQLRARLDPVLLTAPAGPSSPIPIASRGLSAPFQ